MCYRDRMSNYKKIVKGVRERNTQAQMLFYDLFVRAVFLSAYAITCNENEAEEITQDTMLKVFDKTELLHDDDKAMKRILLRIASNAAINLVRRRKDFIFPVEELPDLEDSDVDDDRRNFSMEEIRDAVTTLSGNYRNILSLRLFDDMSFKEIAELLNIKYATARVQYMRGITKLKDLLNKKRIYD